ncbi:hypothetical protein IWX50DRAFT_402327 [Phyllosticta citricarpa]
MLVHVCFHVSFCRASRGSGLRSVRSLLALNDVAGWLDDDVMEAKVSIGPSPQGLRSRPFAFAHIFEVGTGTNIYKDTLWLMIATEQKYDSSPSPDKYHGEDWSKVRIGAQRTAAPKFCTDELEDPSHAGNKRHLNRPALLVVVSLVDPERSTAEAIRPNFEHVLGDRSDTKSSTSNSILAFIDISFTQANMNQTQFMYGLTATACTYVRSLPDRPTPLHPSTHFFSSSLLTSSLRFACSSPGFEL